MMKLINYYNSDSAPDEFVGARVFETHVDFYFPHGYIIDPSNEEDCRKKALNILSLIAMAAPSLGEEQFSSYYKEKTNSFPLKSYLWLIKDFYDNGLISSVEKTYQRNGNGRVNWPCTFKTPAFLTRKGFVYFDMITESKTKTNSILTDIHDYCLRIAFKEIGWVFGIKSTPRMDKKLTDSQKLFYERCLLKEQSHVFNDHKKIMIRHLLRVINYSLGKKDYSDKSEIGTYKFSYVWERMIQEVYGNKPLNEFFPNAIWHIDNKIKEGSHLRPDTVMEYLADGGKSLLILDAKYYKYGLHEDCYEFLPGSSDVQKQITYGDHAMLRHEEYKGKIKNAFVLPFRSDSKEKIKVTGYAESSWRDNQNSYQRVYLLLMDAEYLIESFLTKEAKKNKQEEIVNVLERFIDKNRLKDANN